LAVRVSVRHFGGAAGIPVLETTPKTSNLPKNLESEDENTV
jgi:hypothetical protein